jgi:thiol-disulfide isomerase/thioredoxin
MTRFILAVLAAGGTLFGQAAQSLPFPKIGDPAPEFGFSGVVQADRPLAALTPQGLGGRVLVLEFFATWCETCVAAIPRTNALVAEFKNDPVSFLAVAREPRRILETFLVTHPMSATLVIDDEEKTYNNYWVRSLPFVVIIDTTGRISAFVSPATISSAQIRDAIKR